ncbi:MAG: EamA family transporter [Actinomycetota bacterium]
MIYGLASALGWGLADYAGAIGGRRIGSLPAVVIGQVFSASVMVVVVIATGQDVSRVTSFLGPLVLNGIFTAVAYTTHYRALELGPVAVVSPIGASYAVVGIALAMMLRDERPGGLALLGAAITVVGVALVSTDLRALRAGIRGHAPGVPWAIVSAVGFGVAAFILGRAAQELGWVLGLGASRVAQVTAYVPLVVARRRAFAQVRHLPGASIGIAIALAAGAADLLGVTTYSAGAESGLLSVVLAASAVFPAITVALSIVFLHERLVPNQWAGAALVVAGLVLLGLG